MDEIPKDEVIVSLGEDENEWEIAQLDDSQHQLAAETSSQHSSALPAQLHPVVSLGMKRVSSSYFSIAGSEASNSISDLLSLVDEHERDNMLDHEVNTSVRWNASEVLYHDIMMHVFTFLDVQGLAAFSQTARRPNFECFYFLQLKLQSSLLSMPCRYSYREVAPLSRLAQWDAPAAQRIVQTYVSSNSTLRQMPLSHSLAYIRNLLERHGFLQHMATTTTTRSASHALASAALFIALMGAASTVMVGSTTDSSSYYAAMLPNMLKVGLAGSLMGAGVTATTAATSDSRPMMPMREIAERMARMMQELPSQLSEQLHAMHTKRDDDDETDERTGARIALYPSSIAARIYGAFSLSSSLITSMEKQQAGDEGDRKEGHEYFTMKHPISPNPYEHLPAETAALSDGDKLTLPPLKSEKIPSGCVGAYSRAIREATMQLISLVKIERKANHGALEDPLQVARTFLEACSSDQSLSVVRDMVRIMDVDAFYTLEDGTEACAIHTAAFHGACRVLEFLCQGLADDNENDGGLVDTNLRDANGWTALHFAAGANSVDAVRILANHGAQLAVEANNGYTPFQWAQRLSNTQVAEELQKLGGADHRFLLEHSFSHIANRFFRMSRIQPAA